MYLLDHKKASQKSSVLHIKDNIQSARQCTEVIILVLWQCYPATQGCFLPFYHLLSMTESTEHVLCFMLNHLIRSSHLRSYILHMFHVFANIFWFLPPYLLHSFANWEWRIHFNYCRDFPILSSTLVYDSKSWMKWIKGGTLLESGTKIVSKRYSWF